MNHLSLFTFTSLFSLSAFAAKPAEYEFIQCGKPGHSSAYFTAKMRDLPGMQGVVLVGTSVGALGSASFRFRILKRVVTSGGTETVNVFMGRGEALFNSRRDPTLAKTKLSSISLKSNARAAKSVQLQFEGVGNEEFYNCSYPSGNFAYLVTKLKSNPSSAAE